VDTEKRTTNNATAKMVVLRNVARWTTLKDKIMNTQIINELDIFNLNHEIRINRNNLTHHVKRMQSHISR
jgi:hypothetical protein